MKKIDFFSKGENASISDKKAPVSGIYTLNEPTLFFAVSKTTDDETVKSLQTAFDALKADSLTTQPLRSLFSDKKGRFCLNQIRPSWVFIGNPMPPTTEYLQKFTGMHPQQQEDQVSPAAQPAFLFPTA